MFPGYSEEFGQYVYPPEIDPPGDFGDRYKIFYEWGPKFLYRSAYSKSKNIMNPFHDEDLCEEHPKEQIRQWTDAMSEAYTMYSTEKRLILAGMAPDPKCKWSDPTPDDQCVAPEVQL